MKEVKIELKEERAAEEENKSEQIFCSSSNFAQDGNLNLCENLTTIFPIENIEYQLNEICLASTQIVETQFFKPTPIKKRKSKSTSPKTLKNSVSTCKRTDKIHVKGESEAVELLKQKEFQSIKNLQEYFRINFESLFQKEEKDNTNADQCLQIYDIRETGKYTVIKCKQCNNFQIWMTKLTETSPIKYFRTINLAHFLNLHSKFEPKNFKKT